MTTKLVPIETKPAVQSATLWGLIAVVLPWLDQVYASASALPDGVLPKNVELGIQILGIALATWARLIKPNPPISGVFTTPK